MWQQFRIPKEQLQNNFLLGLFGLMFGVQSALCGPARAVLLLYSYTKNHLCKMGGANYLTGRGHDDPRDFHSTPEHHQCVAPHPEPDPIPNLPWV